MIFPENMFMEFVIALLCINSVCALERQRRSHLGTPINTINCPYCFTKHECDRPCNADEPPKECQYVFNVEWYHTMSTACGDCLTNATECDDRDCIRGDGRLKPVILVNRMLPGPAIRVCHKDTIKVKVINNMVGSESLTIHWHGILQKQTPFMDGVPMVTQCPINRGQSFTYKFKAEPAGTHWWHAHTAMHRGEGVAGALIIKQDVKKDVNAREFDEDLEEHTIFVHDWSEVSGHDRIVKFLSGARYPPRLRPDNMLINGIGYTEEGLYTVAGYTPTVNNSAFRNVFTAEAGKRYRFRVINNAVQFCPLEITLDNHLLTVIATDGIDVEPYVVTHLYVGSGERFDFVVNTDQTPQNYWFRLKTVVACKYIHNAYFNYAGFSESIKPNTSAWEESHEKYKVINKPRINSTFVTDLTPKFSEGFRKDERISGKPDEVHFIGADIVELINLQYNNVTNIPASSPLLSQPDDTKLTCNPEDQSINHSQFCEDGVCKCVHVIDVSLNSLVDLVIFDQSRVPIFSGHEQHLHGYNFHLMHIQQLSGERLYMEQVKEEYKKIASVFNTTNPILKDTIMIPPSGFAVLRFVADNPGVWLLHCHNGMHSNFGMSLSIRVGYPDLPKPPTNFPKCGSWEETSKSIQPLPCTILLMGITMLYFYCHI